MGLENRQCPGTKLAWALSIKSALIFCSVHSFSEDLAFIYVGLR